MVVKAVASARQPTLAELSTRIGECEVERDRTLADWNRVDVTDDAAYAQAKSAYFKANSDLVVAYAIFHRAWKRGVT